jgi:hypothetical protein
MYMKRTISQFISLGVMLLLIAFVISLLPESPVAANGKEAKPATNVAVSTDNVIKPNQRQN